MIYWDYVILEESRDLPAIPPRFALPDHHLDLGVTIWPIPRPQPLRQNFELIPIIELGHSTSAPPLAELHGAQGGDACQA
jgi:hypothetical protein